jgi:hypothetical protein
MTIQPHGSFPMVEWTAIKPSDRFMRPLGVIDATDTSDGGPWQ